MALRGEIGDLGWPEAALVSSISNWDLERVKGIEPSYSAWKSKPDPARHITEVHFDSKINARQNLKLHARSPKRPSNHGLLRPRSALEFGLCGENRKRKKRRVNPRRCG
ncbi:hypothetical protein, partial [Bradyrhizobium sp. P5_C11_2]